MPIINTTPPALPSDYQRRADEIVRITDNQFDALLFSWKRGMDELWACDNTQAVLDALGTNAGSIMLASAKTVTFLEELSPGCTASHIGMVKPFTVNPDGTVTINPE